MYRFCSSAHPLYFSFVRIDLTVLPASRHQPGTTRMGTGMVWHSRHVQRLLQLEADHVPAGFQCADFSVRHRRHLRAQQRPQGMHSLGALFHGISISRFAMEIFADFRHLQCPPALFHDLRIAHIARNIFDDFGHD